MQAASWTAPAGWVHDCRGQESGDMQGGAARSWTKVY